MCINTRYCKCVDEDSSPFLTATERDAPMISVGGSILQGKVYEDHL